MSTNTVMHKVTSWSLDFRDTSSSKYYKVFAFSDGHLVLNWGRIGTNGQTKIEKYTPDEAQIIAKRQVYSKAGKGYKMQCDAFDFAVDDNVHDRVVIKNWGAQALITAHEMAMTEDTFTQRQRLVTVHYDQFIEQTNQVLDAAAKGEEFEPLLARWEALSGAWSELKDKHDHAATAVGMVQQVVAQKLMGP
jgi:predicted DNA-binding WGR domain protein